MLGPGASGSCPGLAAFEDGLEVAKLGDLVPHRLGDHRGHELHQPGRIHLQAEADLCQLVSVLAQFEGTYWARRPGGDLELQSPGRVEDGDLVCRLLLEKKKTC